MYDYCLDYYPETQNSLSDFFDKVTSFFNDGTILLIPVIENSYGDKEMFFYDEEAKGVSYE